jgi:hypothetical protein
MATLTFYVGAALIKQLILLKGWGNGRNDLHLSEAEKIP